MIPWLDDNHIVFPATDKALAEPNGLLCAGGDLSVETLLKAYHAGIFPWFSAPDPILWWTPNPRSILKPSEIHISKSLQKILSKNVFSFSCDKAFRNVMLQCAKPRSHTNGTWISNDMVNAYCRLHDAGYAHSVEVWQDDKLVGGLYGIALGCMFFGESMFSHVSNASKAGFVTLVKMLDQCEFGIIDCQVKSSHLNSLGAYEVEREEFISLIENLATKKPNACPWSMLNQ